MIKCLHMQSNLLSNSLWHIAHWKHTKGSCGLKRVGRKGSQKTCNTPSAELALNGSNQVVPNWNYRGSTYKAMWTFPVPVIDCEMKQGKKVWLILFVPPLIVLQVKRRWPACDRRCYGTNYTVQLYVMKTCQLLLFLNRPSKRGYLYITRHGRKGDI